MFSLLETLTEKTKLEDQKIHNGKIHSIESGQTVEPVPFFQDLNLDQIIDFVCADWGQEVKGLYYYLPKDQATQEYRRGIFSEMKDKGLLPLFQTFLVRMRMRRICMERKEKVEDPLQQKIWFLRETNAYTEALEGLKEGLLKEELSSEGLLGLKAFLEERLSEQNYITFREEVCSLYQELSGFRVLLTYEKERFLVEEGSARGTYDEFLKGCFPASEAVFKSPFLADENFSELESEIIRIFGKNHKRFLEKTERFWKNHQSYANENFLLFPKEMAYYVSYLKFTLKMQENGFAFATPRISKEGLSVTGLYDLALAITSLESGKEVVSNDARFFRGESFFVLTGPNQGGKTTYARSLGQLIYFTKMGLDVPAKAAEVPYYHALLTHFSVEESSDSGRGKLMDELQRLKPMMTKEQERAFVVINELFTTAANYDAKIMGKKVLEFFIGMNCQGIYVTHLNDLTHAHDGVVSLRAMLNEKQIQNYRIERQEAQEIAGANRQVEKYRLTYQQIKERFS